MQDYIPKVYGRRQDKPLKPRQARLMDSLLPKVSIPDPSAPEFDFEALKAGFSDTWLEIGFGGGEHLAWQAAHNPGVLMLGAEPFVNGVAKLTALIDDGALANVRILHGDARPLIEALPDNALGRLFVLHPDPWPKKRHWKRRMISPWFLGQAARLLRPGAELRVASDIPDYVRWTLMHVMARPEFEWTAHGPSDWRGYPDDWPQTRYAAKAEREGRAPVQLIFRRV